VQYLSKKVFNCYTFQSWLYLLVCIKVWSTVGWFTLVNFYNPCLRLEMDKLDDIMDQVRLPVVWTGDFNAHNPLWGSRNIDVNGVLIEDFIDKNNLVLLNNGRLTGFQVNRGSLSCINLTFASGEQKKEKISR